MTMQRIVLVGATMALCLAWNPGSAQLLPPASEEVLLRVTQQELDEDAAGRDQQSHAEAMAEKFGVEPPVVENLRTADQGWGEIAIRLGLARELTKTDPNTYGTTADALQKVGDLRARRVGWKAIAEQLGVPLSAVVADVQRVRQELKAQAKKSATESVVTPGQALEHSKPHEGPRSKSSEQSRKKSERSRK